MTTSVESGMSTWTTFTTLFFKICWSHGGWLERLFILIYPIWAIYLASLAAIFISSLSWQASLALLTALGLGFLAVYPMWMIPLLSSDRLLRALVSGGAIKEEGNQKQALAFADYLTKYGQNGRWMRWYFRSLIGLVLLSAGGLYQLVFSLFVSELFGMLFLAGYLTLFGVFAGLYLRSARRFFTHFDTLTTVP